MSWICPQCKRPFKHKNQWHSCVQVDANSIFKNPSIKKIYEKVIGKVKTFGSDVQVTAAKNAVFAKAPSTFAALKPKKDCLALEFLLADEVNEFPIEKTFRISKNRVAHFIRLGSVEDADSQLFNWLKKAYETVSS